MTSMRSLMVMSALAFGVCAPFATAQDNPIDKLSPVTDEMLLNPPDGDWLM